MPSSESQPSAEQANLVMGLIKQMGGLQAVVDKLGSAGLTQVVQSWIGLGPNQPISTEKVQEVFGASALGKVADKMGVDKQQAASKLAEWLPQVIDKLTPKGQLPIPGIFNYIISLLKALFGTKQA